MPPMLLLADDSLTIRRVIELTFADEDVRVVAVGDGREAIARIDAEPPDIILADVGMPEHDGYEVAAFVKRSRAWRTSRCCCSPARSSRSTRRVRAASDADGVLVKPFEPQLVISARARAAGRCRQGASIGAGRCGRGRRHRRLRRRRRPRRRPPGPTTTWTGSTPPFAAMSASPRPIGVPPAPSPSDNEGIARDRVEPGWGEPVRGADPVNQPRASTHAVNRGSAAGAAAASPSLSDAFVALLAAERGRPLTASPALPAVALSDATIDQIASRVIARLGDESMRQAVLDAAERLVREEIDRIKGGQHKAAGGA